MGFQPFDTRMYKYNMRDNIRFLYSAMLEIENIEHMSKKYAVGYFPTTIRQLVKKSGLTKSQVETNIKKLLDNNIIKRTNSGKLIDSSPSIFYFTEIVNRTTIKTIIKTRNRTMKKLAKLNKINTLNVIQLLKVRQCSKTGIKTRNRTLIKDYLKDFKKTILKDKGIEKEKKNVLSFQQEQDLFN